MNFFIASDALHYDYNNYYAHAAVTVINIIASFCLSHKLQVCVKELLSIVATSLLACDNGCNKGIEVLYSLSLLCMIKVGCCL